MLVKAYFNPDPSTAEAWFEACHEKIAAFWKMNDGNAARALAMAWAQEHSRRLGFRWAGVWKLFKRDVVSRYFWRLEHRSFGPGWSVAEVAAYIKSLSGRPARVSIFLPSISCRAKSIRLPEDAQAITGLLRRLDRSVPVDVFPESSSQGSICFRRYSGAFGEGAFFEAGEGQAMFVFEEEQGRHAILSATKTPSGYVYGSSVQQLDAAHLQPRLQRLVEEADGLLTSRTFVCCRELGIDYLAIEGYFNPAGVDKLIVVDVDLPFDFLFFPGGELGREGQAARNSGSVPARSAARRRS